MGDEVGREKASWVEESAWPFLPYWVVFGEEKSDDSQPMAENINRLAHS